MIVLLLILIWLVVLTPVISHRLSDSNIFTSVARYRSSARLVEKVLGRREDSLPVSRTTPPPAGVSHRDAVLRNAERERLRKERRKMVQRRRRAVAFMLVGLSGSLVFGAVPHLHVFWNLSAAFAFVLVAYVAMLAHVTRLEVNATERREKVIVLPRTIFPVPIGEANRARGFYAVDARGV